MAVAVGLFFVVVFLPILGGSSPDSGFTYNGFSGVGLSLDGIATVAPSGLLVLTNVTEDSKGHAFHPPPLRFRNSSSSSASSFSTTFVVAMDRGYPGGHGIAFVISPSKNFSTALSAEYIGLLNSQNDGDPSNHILAVELDDIESPDVQDIDGNHVGIDVNSVISNSSRTAGQFDAHGEFKSLNLSSGEPVQVWVAYNGEQMQINVTVAPAVQPKPVKPLLSSTVNLNQILLDEMYVGFSSSTAAIGELHYVLGWSFKMNGEAPPLDFSKLPKLPRSAGKDSSPWKTVVIALPIACSVLLISCVTSITLLVWRRMKYAEVREDWEVEFGPHRFSYKDLFAATKGFDNEELLGNGGFGSVYRGVLPGSMMEVAVKRVSHESRQGMREFVAEVVSIGRMRHRNLAQLLGYCRRRGELLLVYEYMPNGSLDKFLYDQTKPSLSWPQRLQIIKGVASALAYLHEEWEKVVIHRDVKASNVLLDRDMNARLGDFGLARLYDHGSDSHTTRIVGTLGYLAPELSRTNKATTATDVFAFGAFVLEVTCRRRPIELSAGEEMLLVDFVLENWRHGRIVESRDPRLGKEEEGLAGEVESVLKLGLHCSHPSPGARPDMRQVMQCLEGDAEVPDLPYNFSNFSMLAMLEYEGFDSAISWSTSRVAASALSSAR